MSCIQEHDDDSPHDGENEFSISMHRCPSGGYYFRIKGEVAIDFDEIYQLKSQLDSIAQTLEWED